MGNRGFVWGLGVGALLALIVLLLPVGTLESFVSRTGLAGALPAAAPPLGTTARIMLALLAFALPTLIGALIGHDRSYTEMDADSDTAPLPVAQQTTIEPMVATSAVASPRNHDVEARLVQIEARLAELPGQIATSPSSRDLDRVMRSIQRSLRKRLPDPAVFNAVRALQDGPGPEALLARLDALETRLADRLADIEARLGSASAPLPQTGTVLRLPRRRPNDLEARRLGETVASIRQSMAALETNPRA